MSPGRLLTNCRVEAAPSASELEAGGARWLNASTDDVLGLASDPRVREASLGALRRFGLQRPFDSQARDELEHRLAPDSKHQALVVDEVSSVLEALPSRRLVVDHRSRALQKDAPSARGPDEAEVLLQHGAPLGILTEALFPLEGDLAPLPRYGETCDRAHATLLVVDRLGLGALGHTGGGVCQHLAVDPRQGLCVSAFGAAVPGAGGLVVGDESLLGELRARLQPPGAATLVASAKALEVLAAEPQRRERLFDVTQALLDGLASLGLDTGPAVTPWIPVWVGEPQRCLDWLSALAEATIAVRAWVSPTASRLLLSLPATASDAQLGQLLEVLGRTAHKLGLPRSSPGSARAEVARPGSYATAAPCAAHWLSPHTPTDEEPDEEPSTPTAGLRTRVVDAVETLTWRATNLSSTSIRWTADAVRALVDRRRRS